MLPVGAVGQFKELVLSAERDQPLQEHLRKVLFLSLGNRSHKITYLHAQICSTTFMDRVSLLDLCLLALQAGRRSRVFCSPKLTTLLCAGAEPDG